MQSECKANINHVLVAILVTQGRDDIRNILQTANKNSHDQEGYECKDELHSFPQGSYCVKYNSSS